MFEDWDLIDASFAHQYGIRLRRDGRMPWSEFSSLLSGLTGETIFGKVVSIRSENDPDILKSFSPDQLKIRREYRARISSDLVRADPARARAMVFDFQASMKLAFK